MPESSTTEVADHAGGSDSTAPPEARGVPAPGSGIVSRDALVHGRPTPNATPPGRSGRTAVGVGTI
jgi:hypothetical protein